MARTGPSSPSRIPDPLQARFPAWLSSTRSHQSAQDQERSLFPPSSVRSLRPRLRGKNTRKTTTSNPQAATLLLHVLRTGIT